MVRRRGPVRRRARCVRSGRRADGSVSVQEPNVATNCGTAARGADGVQGCRCRHCADGTPSILQRCVPAECLPRYHCTESCALSFLCRHWHCRSSCVSAGVWTSMIRRIFSAPHYDRSHTAAFAQRRSKQVRVRSSAAVTSVSL